MECRGRGKNKEEERKKKREGNACLPNPLLFFMLTSLHHPYNLNTWNKLRQLLVRIKAFVPISQVSISTINYKVFHIITNAAGK